MASKSSEAEPKQNRCVPSAIENVDEKPHEEQEQRSKEVQEANQTADSTGQKSGRMKFLKSFTVAHSSQMESNRTNSSSPKIHSHTGSVLDRSSPSIKSHQSEAPPRSRGVALWALARAKCPPLDRKSVSITQRPSFWRLASRLSSNSRMNDRGTARKIQYSNSYRLGPEKLILAQQLEEILQQILHSYLDGEDYKPTKSIAMISSISDVIKQRVKDLNFPRYKIVCFVLIGQNSDQSFFMASRCIWNSNTDNFAEASFQNSSLFAVATVHVLYQE